MKIESKYKHEIIEELEDIAKNMKKEDNLERKIYLYSGAHGILNRILNLDYKPELLFVNYILQRSYETINGGITSFIRGERRIPIPEPKYLLDELADEIDKLAGAIAGNSDCIEILNRIIELSYTTTGNGAYLHYKGIIKI